jgi:hypothetical protein
LAFILSGNSSESTKSDKYVQFIRRIMIKLKRATGIHQMIAGLIFISAILAPQCEKEPLKNFNNSDSIKMKSTHDSLADQELSRYYNLLEQMKKEGYVFYDFRTYLNTDTTQLPKKLLVIRHDIHSRDINYAYAAYEIEEQVIGPRHSTFYVLLDDPVDIALDGPSIENKYMKFLHDMDSCHVDIQPHISPIDLYISSKHPYWSKYPVDSLKSLFSRNYEWEIGKTGRSIKIKGRDVFHINVINKSMPGLLAKFNSQWTKQTGLRVQGYSAHGSGTAMNQVLNNAYLLDQDFLLHSGLYQYDTYNTKILRRLTYLSDNTLPSWMDNPVSIKPGRYEFLMHPYQWRPLMKSENSNKWSI